MSYANISPAARNDSHPGSPNAQEFFRNQNSYEMVFEAFIYIQFSLYEADN